MQENILVVSSWVKRLTMQGYKYIYTALDFTKERRKLIDLIDSGGESNSLWSTGIVQNNTTIFHFARETFQRQSAWVIYATRCVAAIHVIKWQKS